MKAEVIMKPNNVNPLRVSLYRYFVQLILSSMILLTLTGIPSEVRSQDVEIVQDPKLKALYVTAGIGPSTLFIAGHIGLTIDIPTGEFTLRYADLEEFCFGDRCRGVSDISLLYGLRRTKGWIWYDLAGGIGRVWSTEIDWKGESGMGFAFQSTFGWRGIGISGLGNINGVRSIAAVTLNLHIGKLR